MEEVHRKAIQKNFSSLVETTDLDYMVRALYEKGVFSEQMIEPYNDPTVLLSERKRNLYLDIQRRGPLAFGRLIEVLREHGYWDLVRELDPNSSLHMRPRSTNASQKQTANVPNSNSYISISVEKHKTKSESNSQKSYPSASVVSANNNEDDIPFEVKKSTKFIEDYQSKDIKHYRTRGKNRGVLLMFSYVSFENNIETYRSGIEVDCKNLKYLFHELGFTVRSYMDLTLEETKQTLAMLKDVLVDCESVFVVVSSHGYEMRLSSDTDMRCHDGGLLSVREIISYFSNERLPLLMHVPKVFIFQMCRGANKDFIQGDVPCPPHLSMPPGATESDGSGGRYIARRSHDQLNALYSNILIAQSTLPGFVSHRDIQLGSWYIQMLCEVFAEHAHDTHVDELFTLVDKRLSKRFQIQTSSVDRWGFNRHLYLHPGLYE